MKYRIGIKSAKDPRITDGCDFLEYTTDVEAEDRCDAISLAMKETSAEKVDSRFLPLTITIEEIEQ